MHILGIWTLLPPSKTFCFRSVGHDYFCFLHARAMQREAIVNISDKAFDYKSNTSVDSLIIRHVKHGKPQHALSLYENVRRQDSVSPNEFSFFALLKACATLKDLEKGRQIHNDICRAGFLYTNIFIATALVDMYAKCGCLVKARQVFDKILDRNVVSWTTLITGYVEGGESEEALRWLEKMQLDGISANAVTLISGLKACIITRNIDKGLELHSEIEKKGYHSIEIAVGNTLVDMYAKVGLLSESQYQFDHLMVRNVISWTAIIAGNVEHGHGKEALELYEQMQVEGVRPNSFTYLFSLKACGSVGAIQKSEEIREEIEKLGLVGNNLFLGSALIDMYLKLGLLGKAQEAFDNLLERNVVLWNSLIGGRFQLGDHHKVLESFKYMRIEGVLPNNITYAFSLKSCSNVGAIDIGQTIHHEILRTGLMERDILVGNALVYMYANNGLLASAEQVFEKLVLPDMISWNALVLGYAELGYQDKALAHFNDMQTMGISPNDSTFVCALKACDSIEILETGRGLHADIEKRGLLEGNSIISNALLGMYAKYGLLGEAQSQFDRLADQDVLSWTALISGYTESGCFREALRCFHQMQAEGVYPNATTFICILNACGNIGAIEEGQEVHIHCERQDLLSKDPVIGLALVYMYARCGTPMKAEELFDRIFIRDVTAWSALIMGAAEYGHDDKLLEYFELMHIEGVDASSEIFLCALKACGNIRVIDQGQKLHVKIESKGLLGKDPFLGSALIDMYAKCGLIGKAQEVFDKLAFRDTVSCTALITGYIENVDGPEPIRCFERMAVEGMLHDAFTFASFLNACSRIKVVEKGQSIHAQIHRQQSLDHDPVIGNALIDMYAQCGVIAMALKVFESLSVQSVVSWTALSAGFSENGYGEEALRCFEQMQLEGVSPNSGTYICILKACSNIGAIEKGIEIHAEIERQDLLNRNIVVGNSLIDMYSKFGLLVKAQQIFDRLPNRDVVTWTALMFGYSQIGVSASVFSLFNGMLFEGIQPNEVTFVVLLGACTRAGLFNKWQTWFDAMSKEYGIIPTVEHYSCIVDLFARAGQLQKMIETVKKTSSGADLHTWNTILGASRNWGTMELGELAFRHVIRLQLT